jgi:hypothetical protein
MLEYLLAFFKALSAFLASMGIDPAHFTAGFAGAFVRSVIQGKRLTASSISYVLVGALCATYVSPLIVLYGGIAATPGLAFGIGLIGMSLAEGVVKLAHRWAANPKIPTSPKDLADALKDDDAPKDEDKR